MDVVLVSVGLLLALWVMQRSHAKTTTAQIVRAAKELSEQQAALGAREVEKLDEVLAIVHDLSAAVVIDLLRAQIWKPESIDPRYI